MNVEHMGRQTKVGETPNAGAWPEMPHGSVKNLLRELEAMAPGSAEKFASAEGRLIGSADAIGLAIETSALVETIPYRRAVVTEIVNILGAADGDVSRAIAALTSGEFAPLDFFLLGEVPAGGDKARRILEANDLPGPFVDAEEVHISVSRLALLDEGRTDLLGGHHVADRMRQHLTECVACSAEAESVRSSGYLLDATG